MARDFGAGVFERDRRGRRGKRGEKRKRKKKNPEAIRPTCLVVVEKARAHRIMSSWLGAISGTRDWIWPQSDENKTLDSRNGQKPIRRTGRRPTQPAPCSWLEGPAVRGQRPESVSHPTYWARTDRMPPCRNAFRSITQPRLLAPSQLPRRDER